LIWPGPATPSGTSSAKVHIFFERSEVTFRTFQIYSAIYRRKADGLFCRLAKFKKNCWSESRDIWLQRPAGVKNVIFPAFFGRSKVIFKTFQIYSAIYRRKANAKIYKLAKFEKNCWIGSRDIELERPPRLQLFGQQIFLCLQQKTYN
jgi:hypothetical protein